LTTKPFQQKKAIGFAPRRATLVAPRKRNPSAFNRSAFLQLIPAHYPPHDFAVITRLIMPTKKAAIETFPAPLNAAVRKDFNRRFLD